MSEPRPTPETSMEEILASIRRIISEDQPSSTPAARLVVQPQAPAQPETGATPEATAVAAVAPASVSDMPGGPPAASGEPLVLTRMVANDGTVVALDRPAAPAETPRPEPADVLLLTDALPPAPTPAQDMPPRPGTVAEPSSRDRENGVTLEDFVRQSLEPKIQEWLNANLEALVERLVQQKIDEISRRV